MFYSADFPSKVCLGTRVNTCCPTAKFSLGNLVSSTQVRVAGEDVTVAYYLTQDLTTGKWWLSIAIIIYPWLLHALFLYLIITSIKTIE